MAGIRSLRTVGPSTVTDALFLDYCRKLASGVTVVTSCNEGQWSGTTVSTVTSVSKSPPIMLFCLGVNSRTLSMIRHSGRFAAHLLNDQQSTLADRFGGAPSVASSFCEDEPDVWLAGGAPVIADVGAIAWCSLHSLREVGDHFVVFGRLTDVWIGHGSPLIWHDRGYRALELESRLAR